MFLFQLILVFDISKLLIARFKLVKWLLRLNSHSSQDLQAYIWTQAERLLTNKTLIWSHLWVIYCIFKHSNYPLLPGILWKKIYKLTSIPDNVKTVLFLRWKQRKWLMIEELWNVYLHSEMPQSSNTNQKTDKCMIFHFLASLLNQSSCTSQESLLCTICCTLISDMSDCRNIGDMWPIDASIHKKDAVLWVCNPYKRPLSALLFEMLPFFCCPFYSLKQKVVHLSVGTLRKTVFRELMLKGISPYAKFPK